VEKDIKRALGNLYKKSSIILPRVFALIKIMAIVDED